MFNFCDSTVKRFCESNKSFMKTSLNRNIIHKFTSCEVKDVEVITPNRYDVLANLATTYMKPKASHILLAMDDGLYLLSQREQINKALKWKPISKADKQLHNKVMHCINFESSMSDIGLGTPEKVVPSEVRELCLERFRNSMCDVGLSAIPNTNTFGVQTKVQKCDVSTQLLIEQKDVAVDAVAKTTDRSIQAIEKMNTCSTGTDDLASRVNPANTSVEAKSATPFQDMAQGNDLQIQNMLVSIEIQGKSSKNDTNTVSVKMQSNFEAFSNSEDFCINDEDVSTILHILRKGIKKSNNVNPTEEQAQSKDSTAADVPMEGFHETGDREHCKDLGAIPKTLKNCKNQNWRKADMLAKPAYSLMPMETITDAVKTGTTEEELFPSHHSVNSSADKRVCMKINRYSSMCSEVIPVADFPETSMSRTFHLDPTPELKSYNRSNSPFRAFGYRIICDIPISLDHINVPVVDKHQINLNIAGCGIKKLGSGAYGSVYLAEHVLQKDPICVKGYNMEVSDLHEVLMEAKVLLYLRPTGVVPECYGLMESSLNTNDLSLVQECYAGGFTLQKMLTECPAMFDNKRWVNLCYQLLLGLYRIHSWHVLVNDIKWDNILVDVTGVDPNNCVRYIDFGLATFREGRRYPGGSYFMQPFSYLAPEVRNGMATTPASDVYSLGYVFENIIGYTGIVCISEITAMCLKPDPDERPMTVELIERVQAIWDSFD